MTPTTKTESTQILAGKATAISRIYKDKPPYKVGDQMTFTLNDEPYARVRIMGVDAVQSATMNGDFGARLAKGEGHNSVHWWKENLKELYGDVEPKVTWRIRFQVIDTVDKANRFKQQAVEDFAMKSPSPLDNL